MPMINFLSHVQLPPLVFNSLKNKTDVLFQFLVMMMEGLRLLEAGALACERHASRCVASLYHRTRQQGRLRAPRQCQHIKGHKILGSQPPSPLLAP